jgi:hypothetical protein
MSKGSSFSPDNPAPDVYSKDLLIQSGIVGKQMSQAGDFFCRK